MHIHKKTKSGVSVFILNKQSKIDSEAEAMLQALHSRSVGGFLNHIKVLEEKGAENFMSKFYIGYGHKSIGDCGSITIFIEGVSMLCAKAIQDTRLYNGQESSTRYIDFSKQKVVNPLKNKIGENLLEQQRKFYLKLLPDLEKYIKSSFPIQDGQNKKVYDKTIKAKAFDIARGFLPAGFSTNLARHTNLRQVSDRINWLRNHPLQEVKEVAETILEAVIEKYPNSFSAKKYEDSEIYYGKTTNQYYFFNQESSNFKVTKDFLDTKLIHKYYRLFDERPNGKTELPTFLDTIGTLEFEYKLDFGSFRDLQRHRGVYQRMPLLTTKLGFHKWYLDSLPKNLKSEIEHYIYSISQKVNNLDVNESIKQYYTPMGYKVSGKVMGTLPALVYLAELRSSIYVHPSLRPIALNLSEYIYKKHNIKLYVDKSKDNFDVRRGEQDIELK